MEKQDARLLFPGAQEALRKRVIAAVQEGGISPTEAARVSFLVKTTVHK